MLDELKIFVRSFIYWIYVEWSYTVSTIHIYDECGYCPRRIAIK